MKLRLIALCAATYALMPGCASVENPVTGKTERTVMDEQSEIAAGQKAHAQVLAEYAQYDDPTVQAYVDDLGRRLARNSHRPELEWHFTVLDSPEINAFALPGGYVYVTRGIMAYMQSGADLAGVIGHEIGHVTARHGSQRATRQQVAGIGVLAAAVAGILLEQRGVEGAGRAASQLSQGVAAGYIAKYSREQELQADQLGAEYLAGVNYDPRNMVDVIKLLENQDRFVADVAREEGRAIPQGSDWLASHPTSEQRLRDISEIASRYDANVRYVDDDSTRYLELIDGLPFGESREQGVTRGRNFYHEPLGFAVTAPPGWRIQNSSRALALINGEGSAGLVIQNVPPQAGTDHEEIIRNAIQPESGNVERRSINGLKATHFVGVRRNAQGQPQSIELTLVTGPGERVYTFIYAAKDQQSLLEWHREMEKAEATFRPMTEADRDEARPWKLTTVPFPDGGFPELARRSPLKSNAERQLRLLNGYYGGGAPARGQPVKVIQ